MITAGKRGKRGQASIFLAITLLIVITFLAFVINVGLFVKAKINLQNAVDAAAWAGAAVQARQLTNIAWLNWEMRNTYKEWMFKYYVLGNLTRKRLKDPLLGSSARTNFRLRPFDVNPGEAYDRFNVPTICIHFGSAADICDTANIPGIPRFNSIGLPSISDHHESLINAIVSEKAKDCSTRTAVNFGAAMLWAYGVGDENLFPQIPEIAAKRPGAWTQSVELALRMRNLEMMVNTPPIESICADASSEESCTPVSEIENRALIPNYERPVKAFWSAFRNLGGGSYKVSEQNQNSFGKSFTLTELAPTPFSAPPSSLSGFLIPSGNGLEKHYLDLQAYSLNLATFYTTFTTINEDRLNTKAEAACAATKTALPIPGYILGFVKNPAVMTYYAVKGEARHTGMFFPFSETKGIKMSAYAAAKPFGGRIGPRLFGIGSDGGVVQPRNEPSLSRSGPYVSGFDIKSAGATWNSFIPLPFDPNFWIINGSRSLGGTPKSGGEIYFGIPNLVYDFEDTIDEIAEMDAGNVEIQIHESAATEALSRNPDEYMGLYNSRQYRYFRSNLATGFSDVVLDPDAVEESLDNVRRPTRYEALNYLIPTLGNADNDSLEAPHAVTSDSSRGTLRLFAPLYGKDTLYGESVDGIINIIGSYLDYSEPSTEKYLEALKNVAESMRLRSTRGTAGYSDAADSIYKEPLELNPNLCGNLSMAQTFNQYLNGNSTQCQIVPLKDSMRKYFSDRTSDPSQGDFQNFYQTSYVKPKSIENPELMSAYFPGPRQGATAEGQLLNPFSGSSFRYSKRNYYSTKLFAIEKIEQSGNHAYGASTPLYMEKGSGDPPTDPGAKPQIHNTLPTSHLAEFGTPRPH